MVLKMKRYYYLDEEKNYTDEFVEYIDTVNNIITTDYISEIEEDYEVEEGYCKIEIKNEMDSIQEMIENIVENVCYRYTKYFIEDNNLYISFGENCGIDIYVI